MSSPSPSTRSSTHQLSVSALGTFLALVAFTVPVAAINPIAATLGTGASGRTWVLSSMSVGLGAALLSAGTVSDDFGRRRTFVTGLLVLLLGAAWSALAVGTLGFVLARVVQGVGAAAVIAASLGIIAAAFPAGPGRAAASGVWGASVGAGIAVGPPLAAGLDRLASWRIAYVVIALGCLAVAVAAQRLVPESRSPRGRGIDVWGVVLLAGGMSTLLAALVEGRQHPTAPTAVGLAVLAVASLAGFVVVELRQRDPMLDLSLFAHPPFLAATTAGLATGAGIIALMSYLAGFVGLVLHVEPLAAALLLELWAATSVVTALLARRIPAVVTGRTQLALGLAGTAVGQALMLGVEPDSTWHHFVPGLLVAGVSSGVLNAALGREAVASVPEGRGSLGSGANNTARYVGAALGVTVVSVVAVRTPTAAGLAAGWNHATWVTLLVSLAGAAVVLAAGMRAPA